MGVGVTQSILCVNLATLRCRTVTTEPIVLKHARTNPDLLSACTARRQGGRDLAGLAIFAATQRQGVNAADALPRLTTTGAPESIWNTASHLTIRCRDAGSAKPIWRDAGRVAMRVGQSGPAETIWGLVLHIPVGLGVTLSPEAIGCDARDVAAVVHTPLPPKAIW